MGHSKRCFSGVKGNTQYRCVYQLGSQLYKRRFEEKSFKKRGTVESNWIQWGGQIALNVMEKMKNQFNNVVPIGAPVAEMCRSTTKVSMIYAGWDPLSWNIGFGYKTYFAGWFGHTSYFSDKYIKKVASIVDKIID